MGFHDYFTNDIASAAYAEQRRQTDKDGPEEGLTLNDCDASHRVDNENDNDYTYY